MEDAQDARPLGCTRCRYAKLGCSRCRNPNFRPTGPKATKADKAAIRRSGGIRKRRAPDVSDLPPPAAVEGCSPAAIGVKRGQARPSRKQYAAGRQAGPDRALLRPRGSRKDGASSGGGPAKAPRSSKRSAPHAVTTGPGRSTQVKRGRIQAGFAALTGESLQHMLGRMHMHDGAQPLMPECTGPASSSGFADSECTVDTLPPPQSASPAAGAKQPPPLSGAGKRRAARRHPPTHKEALSDMEMLPRPPAAVGSPRSPASLKPAPSWRGGAHGSSPRAQRLLSPTPLPATPKSPARAAADGYLADGDNDVSGAAGSPAAVGAVTSASDASMQAAPTSEAGGPLSDGTEGTSGSGQAFLDLLQENMVRRREKRVSEVGTHPLGEVLGRASSRQARGVRKVQGLRVIGDPRTATWVPPASPYGLIEEQLYDNPWKLLLACMLLNKTSAVQVRKILGNLFNLCPTPEAAAEADVAQIEELIRPLGLFRKRAVAIKRFSQDYITKQWSSPQELHAIGQYAADAYFMFCRGDWQKVFPDDKDLLRYKNWIEATDGLGTGASRDAFPAFPTNDAAQAQL